MPAIISNIYLAETRDFVTSVSHYTVLRIVTADLIAYSPS
jgi:hypothetical protein